MKIAIASDIHLEFGDLHLKNEQNADVLILSGDICTAKVFKQGPKRRLLVKDFFKRVAFQFPHVIYVMGNHESYDFDIAKTYNTLQANLVDLPNIHLLEKESIEIDGVTFIGGTLWTDMNQSDELTLRHTKGMMNDFQLIKNSNVMTTHKNNVYKRDENGELVREMLNDTNYQLVVDRVDVYQRISQWSPEQSVDEHVKTLDYFRIASDGKSKVVVCSHHAPSERSIHEMYSHDFLMNGAYVSHLDDFIKQRPQINLWTHGHVHTPFDYMIGETRVVCNPRGYDKHEQRAKEFQLKYVEVL